LSRPSAGLRPADYFGRTLVASLPPKVRVGVVNVSVAGCKIELFDKNNYRSYASTAPPWMVGIINTYGGNFTNTSSRWGSWRSAGELVNADQNGACAAMNTIIDGLPRTVPTAHVISSKGCSARRDRLHFAPEGYRELGRRYAESMLHLLGYKPAGSR